MFSSPSLLVLAARSTFWLHMRRYWRSPESTRDMVVLGLIVLFLLGVTIAWWISNRRRRNETTELNDPRLLLRDLCRLHRLTWSQCRLLRQVTATRKLESELQLFVEPRLLRDVSAYPALHNLQPRLTQLAEKLFAHGGE
jgi:hypothetical protein